MVVVAIGLCALVGKWVAVLVVVTLVLALVLTTVLEVVLKLKTLFVDVTVVGNRELAVVVLAVEVAGITNCLCMVLINRTRILYLD